MKAQYVYTRIAVQVPADYRFSNDSVAADVAQGYPTLKGGVDVVREGRTDTRVTLHSADGSERSYTAQDLGLR